MYGMIHRAARTMCIEVLGEAAWAELAASAGFNESDFLSAQVYPDGRTMALVTAIAAKANLTTDQTLEAFGRFWITFADKSAYGPVMRMNGDTLAEFLSNLDRMHDTIQRVMTDTRMPSFHVEAASAAHIDVLYQSERTGLEPFVCGLLQGLMARFGDTGEITHAPAPDGVRFRIAMAAAQAA
ncbi:MAG: heme NO-binding domain-containing protein [Hyphomonadaceae bacterium]|nr:heme NO-binding domain-containing protein [Hyphomonadaceae bacterium]